MTSAACPRFAEFVERGVTSGRQLLGLAESYLAPLNAAGVDTLVLGCTHYPLLTGLLSVVMGAGGDDGVHRPRKPPRRSTGCSPSATCSVPTTRRRRGTSSARPGRPNRSSGSAAGSSAPTSSRASLPGGCRMKVTVLGCSGSVPGPDSPASGYLVESEGFRLLVDLGHGAFGALQRYVDPAAVDAIVISHLHADHCIDLTAYIVALRYGGDARYRIDGPGRSGSRSIGPAGTRDRHRRRVRPARAQARPARAVRVLDAVRRPSSARSRCRSRRRTTRPRRTRSGSPRATARWSTPPTPGESKELVELAEGADLFLCEASFMPDDEYVPDLHLTGRQAGEHAAAAGVDRLVVTHVPPWGSPEVAADEAAAAFDGIVEIATPGGEFWV